MADRPGGLKEITLVMCVFNVAGIFLVDLSALQAFGALIVINISFWVLWQFWSGKNWSRILVLLNCGLALLNLLVLSRFSLGGQVLLILEAVLAIYLLWWLNQSEVVRFFKTTSETADP